MFLISRTFMAGVFIVLHAILMKFQYAAVQPTVATDVALNNVNGGDGAAVMVRSVDAANSSIVIFLTVLTVCAVIACFTPEIKKGLGMLKRKFVMGLMLCLLSLTMFTGCDYRKPFDTPEYIDVQPHETAYVIPLEGDVNKQVAFSSAESLEQKKVATKRINVPHRWNKTQRGSFFGFFDNKGTWMPMIRVLKVSRTPVHREWTADRNSGTSDKDQAIWAESMDSVGFSTGITCVAFIDEKDTSQFLYSYNGQSLADVMDGEIRSQVQSFLSDFAAKYPMDKLRDEKNNMIAYIKENVIPYYKTRGITITALGQFGGFTYENKRIQESIDNVFIAQQEKQNAKAMLEAQADKNSRLKMEGEGEAAKLREIAKGEKDAAITVAEGKKQALEMIAVATKTANSDPTFLAIKQLEVMDKQIERWDGKYPVYMMNMGSSGNSGPNVLLNIPSPVASK